MGTFVFMECIVLFVDVHKRLVCILYVWVIHVRVMRTNNKQGYPFPP